MSGRVLDRSVELFCDNLRLFATGEPLLNVVRHRAERGWRCPPAEFERYLDAVARAATFLDQLQLGDQR